MPVNEQPQNATVHRPAPYDARLEAQVVGSIITRYAMCDQLRPEHCYDPRHTAILTAWETLSWPTEQRYVLIRDGDQAFVSLRITGLEDAMPSPNAHHRRTLALYAGHIAAEAPVTTRRDVAFLRLLAAHRGELRRIEQRRLELLGTAG